MHTSTITVAVLPEPTESQVRIDPKDVEIKTMRGTGPGGQNRNKTDSCVQLKHKPTGLIVRIDTERSQHENKDTAWTVLRARIQDQQNAKVHAARTKDRKGQVGSGMRGDKRRTIRIKDDVVTDHVLDKRMTASRYLRGFL